MQRLNHLRIAEVKLPSGEEWMDPAAAWRFLQVRSGAAYWLGAAQNRPLAEGETLVIPPAAKGVIRASKLGDVIFRGFVFAPDWLCGLLSLTQRHFFETRAAKTSEVQFLPSTHPVSRRLALVMPRRPETGDLSQTAEGLAIVAAAFEEEMARFQPPASRGKTAQNRFTQIIVQMPDAEFINHPPEALARLCGCSPRHFNRLYREHFGVSTRARQSELRLLKARQLLLESDAKIIHVALESGYRNLSLFNSLFKKRFGMTPSGWRRKAAKKSGLMHGIIALLLPILLLGATAKALGATNETVSAPAPNASAGGQATNAPGVSRGTTAVDVSLPQLPSSPSHLVLPAPPTGPTNRFLPLPPPAARTNQAFVDVKGYEVIGNTLLPDKVVDQVLQKYIGPGITFDAIHQASAELKLAYYDRGYVTVAAFAPNQQITNGIVKMLVIEGRLVDLRVVNNRYFSSNNVMRELPSLRTNIYLNRLVFQQEIDRANANHDRQIYPVVEPGPLPGTSALELRVKDRLPLHFHVGLDNNATPGSPELRLNLAAQYNNLWQLDHQFGVQYSMTPDAVKAGGYALSPQTKTNIVMGTNHVTVIHKFVNSGYSIYDQPLIDNYSAFYRMPLSGVNGPPAQRDYTVDSFGYDEATHRFVPPPPTGASELLFFASRSVSDTGMVQQSLTNSPNPLPSSGGLQVANGVVNRTLNPNEDIGARWLYPLADFFDIKSTLSVGGDFKNYRSTLIQERLLQATLFVPAHGTNGPPWNPPNGFVSPPLTTTRVVFNSVEYLPISIGYNASRVDKSGSTSFDLLNTFQVGNLLSSSKEFERAAGDPKADGRFDTLAIGLTRDQVIYHGWGVRLHSDAQWANEPLLSNEQYSLGGQNGPRAYHEGELYGDTGWRASFEPHSPYLKVGLVDGTIPMLMRFYAFLDYGKRYHLGEALPKNSSLAGTGLGFAGSIGEHLDFRLQLGMALLDVPPSSPALGPDIRQRNLRLNFGIGIQF